MAGKPSTKVFKSKKDRQVMQNPLSPTAFPVFSSWLVDPRYPLAYDPNSPGANLEDYNRAAFGASVIVAPSPNKANQVRRPADRKEHLLLSYMTFTGGVDQVVNGKVCVNKVNNDGTIAPYVSGARMFRNDQLAIMLQTGFSSDYVYDVRIDFPVERWSYDEAQAKYFNDFVVTGSTRGVMADLETLVVLTTDITGVISRNCEGCMRGAGCVGPLQVRKTIPSRNNPRVEVKEPSNSRAYLALYGGSRSRDIFYDYRTFGFFLSRLNRGKVNDDEACGSYTMTSSFRNDLAKKDFKFRQPMELPIDCTSSFEMQSDGSVVKNNIPVGGTSWADTIPGVNDRELFGCAGDIYRVTPLRTSSSDVEHIIERSTLDAMYPVPLVDLVMAWGLWNSDNGGFRLQNEARPGSMASDGAAEREKRVLYGVSVYRCVQMHLGGIVVSANLDAADSCNEETWSELNGVCNKALVDVLNRV